jgi:hypothetical protein
VKSEDDRALLVSLVKAMDAEKSLFVDQPNPVLTDDVPDDTVCLYITTRASISHS